MVEDFQQLSDFLRLLAKQHIVQKTTSYNNIKDECDL